MFSIKLILLYCKEHGNLYTRKISGFFNFACHLSQEIESFRWLKNDPYEQLLLISWAAEQTEYHTCIINHVEK